MAMARRCGTGAIHIGTFGLFGSCGGTLRCTTFIMLARLLPIVGCAVVTTGLFSTLFGFPFPLAPPTAAQPPHPAAVVFVAVVYGEADRHHEEHLRDGHDDDQHHRPGAVALVGIVWPDHILTFAS